MFPVIRNSNKNSQEWRDALAAANGIFTSPASEDIHIVIKQAQRRVDTAFSRLQNAETYVESLENNLGIEERWTAASSEYNIYHQENVVTNYVQALDELERLVVMQLFELVKMSSSGTGK